MGSLISSYLYSTCICSLLCAPSATMDLKVINELDDSDFIRIFGNIVEKHDACALFLSKCRPFYNHNDIYRAASQYISSLDLKSIEEVVLLHPDLVGRIADDSMLTVESQCEQRAAGLRFTTQEESQLLAQLNALYKAKFGFPFVICARENKCQAILQGLTTRLGNEKECELLIAQAEISKILSYRLQKILQ